MIERIHLAILREIDQKGSLTAAASALHVTQSALSHSIKKLEQRSGAKLWHKQGKHLQLTQAGLYLLHEAKRILPQLEHAEQLLEQYASGEKGILRIGMECHPCYRWLLNVVEPFLQQWPEVDVDVKQRFQFGGVSALFNRDIDILITPDPIIKKGIEFQPVFAYEQVLIASVDNPLSQHRFLKPQQLCDQVLISYPVAIERLDIYQQFLLPANCSPKKHKELEATEIILQMVAANRGVATLPKWLADEYAKTFAIQSISLGEQGIQKSIHIGMRSQETISSFSTAFIEQALKTTQPH